MGSIPVAGAKSHLNRKIGLGGFSHPHGELSSKLCFELGAHFRLRPMGARSQKVRRK